MPGPIARLTWTGSLPSGEVFEHAFCIVYSGGGDIAVADAATIGDSWLSTFLTGTTPANTLFNANTKWNAVRAEILVAATGKVSEQKFGVVTGAGTDLAANATLPPGVATAVTLRATSGADPVFGRFYLPPPRSTATNNTGRWNTTDFTRLTGALANAFTALSAGTPFFVPAVYSRKHLAAYATFSGDVGDVFDSMRTRRDKLVEARTSIFSH